MAWFLPRSSHVSQQLTATLIAEPKDLEGFAELIPVLELKAGRLLLNGCPTGAKVCEAMAHGGPYPNGIQLSAVPLWERACPR